MPLFYLQYRLAVLFDTLVCGFTLELLGSV